MLKLSLFFIKKNLIKYYFPLKKIKKINILYTTLHSYYSLKKKKIHTFSYKPEFLAFFSHYLNKTVAVPNYNNFLKLFFFKLLI